MANVTVIPPVKAEGTIHKIRCAAYCRVSSSSEDQLHSYAAQVKFYGEKFDDSDTEELIDIPKNSPTTKLLNMRAKSAVLSRHISQTRKKTVV